MKMRNLILIIFVASSTLFAEEKEDLQTALISESFGHIIGNRLKYLEIPLDIAQFIKGIQDASDGKESPLSEKECIEAIRLVQDKKIKELSKKNLKEAEMFLENNAKEVGIVTLAEGKVQCQIVSEGTGSEIKPHFVPLIRYKVKTLDGSVADTEPQEESLSLDETIEGLKVGLLGMKEGEKRVLYIHPEFAYGDKGGRFFPPNSLFVFEIEILKADTRR